MTDKLYEEQKQKMLELEQQVAEMALDIAKLKTLLSLLNETLKDLVSKQNSVDEASEVYERYTQGLKTNRSVSISSEIVAIFAHYNIRKNLPTKTIARSGLLTMGKAYGIASWNLQFLHDFLEVNKLKEVYENASTMKSIADKYPAIAELNKHL